MSTKDTKPPEDMTLGQRLKAEVFVGDPPEPKTPEWDALVEEMQAKAMEWEGKQVCASRRASAPWPCTNSFLGTGNRCKMHGGAAPKAGRSHPCFKNGRASKVRDRLPQRFRESFGKLVEDPELLSMRPEIAVLDERFYELLDKLDTGESAAAWEVAGDLSHDILEEVQQQDPDLDALTDMAKNMVRLVSESRRYGSLWGEISGVAKSRKDLVETESKRLKDAGATMDAASVLGLVHRVLDLVFRHVTDRKAMEGILRDVDREGLIPPIPDDAVPKLKAVS